MVEATGTGGGFKLFCEGVGEATPDIAGASRQIKDSEIETCAKNGVAKITEIPIGHDGIVIANAKDGPDFNVTRTQLFLALAKNVPQGGALVPNPYRTWNDIDPSLPAERIEVLGPPPTSGTRDAFVELVMDKGCETVPEIAALQGDAKKAACQQVREDGAYIDAGENDNLIVQKLQANPAAFGIFGYSFLEQNADTLKAAKVEDVAPTYEAISGQQYPVARDLFVYVKDAHRTIVPGIDSFVRELVSERAMGPEGYLADKGLVPFTPDERKQIETRTLAALGLDAVGAAGADTGGLAALSGLTRSTGTTVSAVLIAVLGLSLIGYFMGRSRSVAVAGGNLRRLHSLPNYHGFYVALWCGLPSLLVALIWLAAQPAIVTEAATSVLPPERVASLDENQLSLLLSEVRQAAAYADLGQVADPAVRAGAETYRAWQSMSNLGALGAAVALALIGIGFAYRRINVDARSRNRVERIVLGVLFACSCLAILTTVGIVLSLVFESLRFFAQIPITEFLFGLQWSPQMAMRADQVGSSGAFGAIPVIAGTLLITVVAMVVAVPTGLMIAVYLSDYAGPKVRTYFKPLVEILAGIPTVVYGFFAALTIGPILRDLGATVGPQRRLGKRIGRRPDHGRDDHPIHLVAVRRRDECGAAELARRFLCAGRHQVGDHPPSGVPGRPARHRRRRPAGRQPRHRRDHDRGDGGGTCRQPHGQSAGGRHDRDGADRHLVGGRPGIRQPEDPRGLRPRAAAVRGHPGSQHHRTQHCAQIPREV